MNNEGIEEIHLPQRHRGTEEESTKIPRIFSAGTAEKIHWMFYLEEKRNSGD